MQVESASRPLMYKVPTRPAMPEGAAGASQDLLQATRRLRSAVADAIPTPLVNFTIQNGAHCMVMQ